MDNEEHTTDIRQTAGLLHDHNGPPTESCCCESAVCDRASTLKGTTTTGQQNGSLQNLGPPDERPAEQPAQIKRQQVHISDLLGEYGNYQLFLTLLTFVRYICLAMMTNTGPLIAPSLAFWCQLPHVQQQHAGPLTMPEQYHHQQNLMNQQIAYLRNITTNELAADRMLRNKCFLAANGTSGINQLACTQWTFDRTKTGITLTDEFNLVCDRDWLRSAFQSSISIGVAIASVVFGAASDEHGRRLTMNVCLVVSLLAGLASYCAPNYLTFTLSRSLCTMCDLCIAGSLYTVIVETLGNKYRGIVCLIVTTGWSIGVMVMPWVTGYFRDFRKVMLFTVACHTITLPWLLIVAESPRWLLINGRMDEVRRQVQWICRSWNGKSKEEMLEIEENFEILKSKYLKSCARRRSKPNVEEDRSGFVEIARLVARTLFGGFSKIGDLFKSRELLVTTAVFIWIIFNSELLYMFFIFINSDHDDNIKLNYAIGGLMESLATLTAIIMITCLTRRLSLSLTLTLISISMVGFSFTYDRPDLSVYTLNITKLVGSTLTSLVFVVITELFPTSLRQTGTGISTTLGSCGAIMAPFVHNELAQLIGFRNVILILCMMPLTAALLVPFFLRETKGVELADDVDEIEP